MFTKSFSDSLRNKFADRVLFDEPLAKYLAYSVGGPADALIFPYDEEELVWISDKCREAQVPITIVGTGTNLLVRDEGIRGVTLSLAKAFQKIEVVAKNSDGSIHVRAGGGIGKPQLLEWAAGEGLTGLEFSSGVPGTIGGGIFMNAGTKYGCYGDILKDLRLFDFKSGGRNVSRSEAHFGYREQTAVKDTLVVWATFELKAGDKTAIRAEIDRIIAERAAKQPLDHPSCGSTFKNPEGHSAGRLIEKAGLKGTRIGGAEISEKHANFILNKGNASANDILSLIRIVKEKVRSEFGIALECEVIILGGTSSEGQISF
jgi:UDP-N-acetylmuramate dehydrogenase